MSHISIFARNASQWRKKDYLPPPPCHMCHSQNFDKIDSFLNPVLNICILSSLIVGWGKWVIKEVAGILHQIYRFTGGATIWGSRFHQKKSRYYLGPSQTSQVEIVFSYKPLTFYCKNLQLECFTGCVRRFQKTLFVFY